MKAYGKLIALRKAGKLADGSDSQSQKSSKSIRFK